MNNLENTQSKATLLGLYRRTRTSRWYPWVVVLMSSLFLFYKYVVQVYPSVMTSDLMQHFHLNGLGLGNLAVCYFYSYLVVQLFVGPLLDRFSTRLLSSSALLLMSISVLGFSQAQNLSDAYFWRCLMGVGAAFATVSYLKLTANWFSSCQFNFVAGLLLTAASVGAMVGQAPLAYSVQTHGWQHTLYDCAILGFAVSTIYFFLVSDHKKTTEKQTQTKSKVNLKAMLNLLKSKKTWVLTLYSGCAWAPIAVFGGLWGNPYLQAAYHFSKTESASMVTVAFLGLACGGPFFGWLAGLVNRRLPFMLVGLLLTLASVCYLDFGPASSVFLLIAVLFLFGLGTGAFMLGFGVGQKWFSSQLAASVVALINTGDALLGAFSEPLVGKLLDVFGQGHVTNGVHTFSLHTYHVAFSVLPVYLVVALLMTYCIWRFDKTV